MPMVGLLAVVGVDTFSSAPAGGSWVIALASAGKQGAAAATHLAAPTGVQASCSGLVSLAAHVVWNAVSRASTYRIWRSTSATTGFTVVASGVTATSWTSSTLSLGTYYFEVSATAGTHWVGPQSAASNSITILAILCSAG